jgi:hypothetical protein
MMTQLVSITAESPEMMVGSLLHLGLIFVSCVNLSSIFPTMCTTGLLFHFYQTYFGLSCYLDT